MKHFTFSAVLLLLLLVTWVKRTVTRVEKTSAFAVVGGGISGASTAYYLRQLFADEASIDIFEPKDIGGRLATVPLGGKIYNAGATIIHPENAYMVNFTRLLGLKARDKRSTRLGVFNGQQMVFDGSGNDYMLAAQLLWRYGWDVFRLQSYIRQMLTEFSRIYEHQDAGLAFTTVEHMLSSMSHRTVNMLHVTLSEELQKAGFSELFVHELVSGGLRGNYGQEVDMHAFVGSVALAGAQPGLWSVHGGNQLVAEGLIKRANANIIKAFAKKVILRPDLNDLTYKLEIQSPDGKITESSNYDFVIIAIPVSSEKAKIAFEGFPKSVADMTHPYHTTVATFIQGFPNVTKFGFKDVKDLPEEILTTGYADIYFYGLGKQVPSDFKQGDEDDLEKEVPVWKVFSPEPLTTDQMNDLFVSYNEVTSFPWQAYPHYTCSQKKLPPFQLYRQLYYVNTMELAASAMETCIISGRNAALLAYNTWHGLEDKIDHIPQPTKKTEL